AASRPPAAACLRNTGNRAARRFDVCGRRMDRRRFRIALKLPASPNCAKLAPNRVRGSTMISDRRQLLTALAAALAMPGVARAQSPAMSKITAYAFSFAGLEGGNVRLSDFAGKPILVVNTASQCGYTPQFTGLQQLYARYHDKGLEVIGVPSNDFGGQEPGTPVEIMQTAHDEYGVR